MKCNVLHSMSVLIINALNVDMQADLKDPFREVDHLVNQIQIVDLTLIAMKMNHARMAIVYSAIVIQDKHACTVSAKRKWIVTERKNAIMDKFVSMKNVTKFVRVEHCVLKNISVDLMFVCQTHLALVSAEGTIRKNVKMAFGVTQFSISVFQRLSALEFHHARMEHIHARNLGRRRMGIVTLIQPAQTCRNMIVVQIL